jgi:purine-nucleoside phosphorylase
MSAILNETVQFLHSRTNLQPEFGIVLGTGLASLVNHMVIQEAISYSQIPGFPISTVDGHIGKLIFGHLNSLPVVVLQGRFHFYEGYPMEQIIFPIRVMRALGIHSLFLSNAAGGLNPDFVTGDLMLINDHINLIPNPLIGAHDPDFGERFPDMTEAYDHEYLLLAEKIAVGTGLKIRKGCYVGVPGPSFETPAEYRFYRLIGGDAIGMSTLPEVIAARQLGIRCFAISIITNTINVGTKISTAHKEVLSISGKLEPQVSQLIQALLAEIAQVKN